MLMNKPLLGYAIRYAVIGGTCALLDFSVFHFLHQSTNRPLISSGIGVSAGITMSYFLNSKFNFKKKYSKEGFAKFWLIGGTGLAVSTALIQIGIWFGFEPDACKLISIPIIAAMQFLLNAMWTFAEKTMR